MNTCSAVNLRYAKFLLRQLCNRWVAGLLLAEKLLTGIFAAGIGGEAGPTQQTLLFLLNIAMLVLFIWRRPYRNYGDNVHRIATRLNQVMVMFALFLAAVANAACDAFYSMDALGTFATVMNIVGTVHLLIVQFIEIGSTAMKVRRTFLKKKRPPPRAKIAVDMDKAAELSERAPAATLEDEPETAAETVPPAVAEVKV